MRWGCVLDNYQYQLESAIGKMSYSKSLSDNSSDNLDDKLTKNKDIENFAEKSSMAHPFLGYAVAQENENKENVAFDTMFDDKSKKRHQHHPPYINYKPYSSSSSSSNDNYHHNSYDQHDFKFKVREFRNIDLRKTIRRPRLWRNQSRSPEKNRSRNQSRSRSPERCRYDRFQRRDYSDVSSRFQRRDYSDVSSHCNRCTRLQKEIAMTKEDNNELRRKIEELSNTLKEVENNDKNVIKEQRYFVLNQFYTLTHTHTHFLARKLLV